MTTYISILRGINVSGQRKIKMADLKNLYESIGYQEVKTYIQSGNVVFKSDKKKESIISEAIHKEILAVYKFEVPILVKTLKDFQIPLKNNPFLKKENIDITKLHVTFLAEKPATTLIKAIEELSFLPDEFSIKGKEVYIFCPNGYGRTKLTNTFFERKLKVAATTRNWKSVNKVFEIASDL